MSNGFGLMIESLVAILLLLTIAYSVILNKRLKRLRADEMALKATISELITATEIAERAIGGLKLTVRECDQGLGEQLRSAERFSAEIGRQITAGTEVLARLNQIVAAAQPPAARPPAARPAAARPAAALPAAAQLTPPQPPAMPAIAPDALATVKAAQAFAARARNRARGVAA